MKLNEWKKLAKGLKSMYTSERFMPDNDAVNLWYLLLKDFRYEDVSLACKAYMATEHFPPVAADIRQRVIELNMPAATADWSKSWDEVVKAISRYGYSNAKKAMNSFDEITRRCVRGLGGFKQLCKSENLMADRAHFRKAYEQIQGNAKQTAMYTSDIQKAIADNQQKQLQQRSIETAND